MPHPVPDDKCEKKYWLKVLALNLNHFGKKIDIFLLLLKNPNDFFLYVQLLLPPYENYEKVHDYCQPPLPLFNSCEFFSCFEEKMKNQSLKKHYKII